MSSLWDRWLWYWVLNRWWGYIWHLGGFRFSSWWGRLCSRGFRWVVFWRFIIMRVRRITFGWVGRRLLRLLVLFWHRFIHNRKALIQWLIFQTRRRLRMVMSILVARRWFLMIDRCSILSFVWEVMSLIPWLVCWNWFLWRRRRVLGLLRGRCCCSPWRRWRGWFDRGCLESWWWIRGRILFVSRWWVSHRWWRGRRFLRWSIGIRISRLAFWLAFKNLGGKPFHNWCHHRLRWSLLHR